MKKSVWLIFAVLVFVSGSVVEAQNYNVADAINRNFESGTYLDISEYMTDDIEAFILNRQCNGASAVSKELFGLFSGKRITDYKVLHLGENDNSTFIVASFALSGTQYRINILLKENRIAELRIDDN
ncbi:MAG: DUF4783 domain-containing protein [Candidatus Aphodosoma sp.]